MSAVLLYCGKFVVFEFQPVTHIDAERQQGDGYFADHASAVVFDIGVISADIDYSAKHMYLFKNPPLIPGAGKLR